MLYLSIKCRGPGNWVLNSREGTGSSHDEHSSQDAPQCPRLSLLPCTWIRSARARLDLTREAKLRGQWRFQHLGHSCSRSHRGLQLPWLSETAEGGHLALLFIHKAEAKARDWAAGRYARPGAMTGKASAPRPYSFHWGNSTPTSSWIRVGPRSWDTSGDPAPTCPSSHPGLLRQLSPYLQRGHQSTVPTPAGISLVPGEQGAFSPLLQSAGCENRGQLSGSPKESLKGTLKEAFLSYHSRRT